MNSANIVYDTDIRSIRAISERCYKYTQTAAAKVAEVWYDVPGWWNSPVIQETREYFCHRFSRTQKNLMQVLKETLDSVVSEKRQFSVAE